MLCGTHALGDRPLPVPAGSPVSSGPYFLSFSGPECTCLAPQPGRASPQQQLCHQSWGQRLVVRVSRGRARTLLSPPLTSGYLAQDGMLCSLGVSVQAPRLLTSGSPTCLPRLLFSTITHLLGTLPRCSHCLFPAGLGRPGSSLPQFSPIFLSSPL